MTGRLSLEKSVPQVWQDFVTGQVNDVVGLASASVTSGANAFTGLPVKGLYVFTLTTTARDAATAAVAVEIADNLTITAAGDLVTLEVGDLVIPFNPAVGTGAEQLNETLVYVPVVVQTEHVLPLTFANLTAAATDPNDVATLHFLLIKLVTSV